MQGFKPGAKPKDKAKGGKIQGPGTGTSDSIKAEIPKGSYIMPTDSTEQIGAEALSGLGMPVPVNVSNGEYQMPPEQVHAVGVQALNQMRDATHAPVAAGFKPQEGELYFANGGSPAEEEVRARAAPAQPAAQQGGEPAGFGQQQRTPSFGETQNRINDQRTQRTGTGLYGTPRTQAQIEADTGLPGYQERVNAIPGPNENALAGMRRINERNKPGVSAQPTTPVQLAAQRAAYDFTPDPQQGPALGMSVRPTSARGINRIDNAPGLSSPLFTNLPTGQAVSEMQGGTVSTVPAFKAPAAPLQEFGFNPSAVRQGPSGGVIGSGADQGRDSLIRAASTPYRGAQNGQLTANQLRTLAGLQEGDQRAATEAANQQAVTERAAMQEYGATARSLSRDAIDRSRAAGEARVRGFEARGLERMEKLYEAYESAKTPEDRARVAEQLRALSGKEAPNRYTVVPGGQEFDPAAGTAVTRPSRVFNNQTGQFVEQQGGQQQIQSVPPKDQLRIGQVYQTARGVARWDGKQFVATGQ